MTPYHKIQSIYKRTPKGVFIVGEWATPELEALADAQWTWTEKVDGTNIRIWEEDGRLVIGGRTDRANLPAHLVDAINQLIDPKELVGKTLYGEGYGVRIQKGGGNYRSDSASFVLFDVKVGSWWLKREDVAGVAIHLDIELVAEVGAGTLHEAIAHVAAGQKSAWGDFEPEGIVCRPAAQLFDRQGRRIICKVKAKDLRRCGLMT